MYLGENVLESGQILGKYFEIKRSQESTEGLDSISIFFTTKKYLQWELTDTFILTLFSKTVLPKENTVLGGVGLTSSMGVTFITS